MSQYNTGSIALTSGSAVVTGTSTLWLANIAIADGFTLIGSGITYDVQSVDSDTQITLSTPYTGITGAGLAYTIIRDFTAVLGLPYPVQGDVDTASVVKNALNKLDAGIKVTSFNHRGDWLTGTTYTKYDAVADAGGYFVSKILNNTGHTPPASPSTGDAFWGLVSARGVQGQQGIQGSTGTQGVQGITGNTGLQGIQGSTGQGFVISVIFDSLALLLAGTVPQGEFGLVAGTLIPSNADYGKLYLYDAGAWTYITDMSVVGAQGITGPQGVQGATGSIGSQGVQGVTGSIGPVGLAGNIGPQGTQGNQGSQGVAGTAVNHTTRTVGTGAAGTVDTYTLWGDAAGTLSLGTYTVTNGTDGVGAGDMIAATYDPTAKAVDAFAMVNMVEGMNANVLTDLERTAIAANTAKTGITASQATAIAANTAKTSYPVADSNKLAGIASSATANAADTTLLARANHTGTQLLNTISDAGTAASKNVPATGDALAGEVVLGSDSRLSASSGASQHSVDVNTQNIMLTALRLGYTGSSKNFVDAVVESFADTVDVALTSVMAASGVITNDLTAVSQLPLMTGYSTPSGLASSSSEYDTTSFNAWRTFAGQNWAATANSTSPQWVQYQSPTALTVAGYAFSFVWASTYLPTSWALQGSNNGSNWVTLASDAANTQQIISGVFPTGSYTFFRLTIYAGGVLTGVRNLRLFGIGQVTGTAIGTTVPAFAIPTTVSLDIPIKGLSTDAVNNFTALVSRDSGTTYTPVPLTLGQAYNVDYAMYHGAVDVSAQPVGLGMRYKLIFNTGAPLTVTGIGMGWR